MIKSLTKKSKQLTSLVLLPLLLASLIGCEQLNLSNLALIDTKGPIGDAIGQTMWYTFWLMLIVVIPTICLSIWIPYKFRASNKKAKYEPEWHHSNKIEAIIWGIPIAIVAVLAVEVYRSSHAIDPSKPLISIDNPQEQPLKIQVVALNWKWLFIYPEQGIATINEVAIPKDRAVQFLLTSDGAINAFFIPRLGSMLYAMSGMESNLNLMATEEGVFEGKSANYSGYGFTGMRFKVLAKDQAGFDSWVTGVKNSGKSLDDTTYDTLKQKSRNNKVEYFSNPQPLRFKNIIENNTGLKAAQEAIKLKEANGGHEKESNTENDAHLEGEAH